MSKFSKLMSNPKLFFEDFSKNRANKNKHDALINNQAPLKDPIVNRVPVTAMKSVPKVGSTTSKKINKDQMGYLAELTAFAREFDVNSLKYKDEYLWPYLRQHLWVQLYFLGFGKNAIDLIPHRLQLGTRDNIKGYVRSAIKEKLSAVEVDEVIADEVGIDFLFITVLNASEQVELEDGSLYYRLTDPLYEAACKLGTAKKVEFIKVNSPALDKCKRYKFKPEFILSPSITKSGYAYSMTFHHKFFDLIKASMPSLKLTEKSIMDAIDWEMHTRDYYLEVLGKIKPKILFVNGYHYHAPLLSAANALGIVTVDVQHGIQVGWNPLYNNWNELPREGYQALPDVFWVWGQKELESINKVFNSQNHQAVIGGFPWLDKQLDYMAPVNSKYLKIFSQYKRVCLLILQNQKNISKEYKEIIENSADDTAWIIRHHPKGNKFKATDFSSRTEHIYIGEYFDRLSLVRLFEVVHVCVSAGSTVAVEADYFGVFNIIFTSEGKSNYITEITDGHFYFANNSDEFNHIVLNLDFSIKKSKLNCFINTEINDVFGKLLNIRHERKKND